MTRRGRLVAALAVLLLVAGRILGVTELFGLAVAAAVVLVVGLVRVRAPQLRIGVEARIVPSVVPAGERASLELDIENTGSVPTPGSRLRLQPGGKAAGPVVEVPRLVPGEAASVALLVPTDKRGRHEIAGFEAVLGDGLGLAERRITGIGPSRYGVSPVSEYLPSTLPTGEGGGSIETTRSSAERLTTGASLLRPYLEGDDLRRIHWATTARVGEIMVREGGDRERDAAPGTTIVLCGRIAARTPEHSEAFEDAVRIVASLAAAAERDGPLRLVVPGSFDSRDGSGGHHLQSILESLIDVNPSVLVAGSRLPSLEEQLPPVHGIVVLVVPCAGTGEFAALAGAEPSEVLPGIAALVAVQTGAQAALVEAIGRSRLLVSLPIGASLAELWADSDQGLVRL